MIIKPTAAWCCGPATKYILASVITQGALFSLLHGIDKWTFPIKPKPSENEEKFCFFYWKYT